MGWRISDEKRSTDIYFKHIDIGTQHHYRDMCIQIRKARICGDLDRGTRNIAGTSDDQVSPSRAAVAR